MIIFCFLNFAKLRKSKNQFLPFLEKYNHCKLREGAVCLKRKLFALVLSVAMAVGLLPISALANGDQVPRDNIEVGRGVVL